MDTGQAGQRKAVFLDKDGTLIPDIPYNVDPARICLNEGVAEGLRQLAPREYIFIVVSNQAGVAHGYFEIQALQTVKRRIHRLLSRENITLHGFYFCPHHPEGSVVKYTCQCQCRKPQPGMLLQAARDWNIDLTQSWMIGDILHDVEAGNRAGCRAILIDNGNETEWQLTQNRMPAFTAADFRQAASYILAHS